MTQACSILVIEDEPDLREGLREALTEEGYAVEIAPDGLAGLSLLREGAIQPQLILLDLMMPAVSGWEFHAAIRKDPKFSRIPILVLSAVIDQREQTWMGVPEANCIRKPFELSTLLSAIERHCKPSPAEGTAAS